MDDDDIKMAKKIVKRIACGVGVVILILFAWSSVYTVQEGHMGIVKRWGKATEQVGPGLHFKIPIMHKIEHLDVRQRKNVEELFAATQNQLAIRVTTSINWTVNKSAAIDLFRDYGGLDQFEGRILDPKLRSAAKAALAKFPADKLIQNRQQAVSKIMENMTAELQDFPIIINSPQIENITFPKDYSEAVLAKESTREVSRTGKACAGTSNG